MIGFIKNLISGILNFFSGLFSGKKGNGYYLELKEDAEATLDEAKKAVESAASNAKKAVESAVESAASNTQKVLETATSTTQKAAETATSNTQKVLETATSTTQKAAETATSNTQKAAKKAASNSKKAVKTVAETAPAVPNGSKDPAAGTKVEPGEVELVQTAKGVKAQSAKKAKAPIQEQPKETTFAPKYLVPTNSNGRRRPGANMSSFLDMARQVKTPG